MSDPTTGTQRSQPPIHVTVQIIVLIALCGLSLLTLLSVAINAALFLTRGHLLTGPSPSSAYEHGRQVGHFIGMAAPALAALLNLVWAPINALGLWKRRPWAAMSTTVFWVVSIFTLCCAPFGIYGVIAMSRPAVREWLSGT